MPTHPLALLAKQLFGEDTFTEEAPREGTWLGRMLLAQQKAVDPRMARVKQIDQYEHPDQPYIPDALYRPTSLTKFQDRAFKSLAQYLPERISMPQEMVGKPIPVRPTRIPDNRNVNIGMGLGGATHSLGQDEKGPYYSIFDSWDFDEPFAAGAPQFMNEAVKKSGTPFNIYDRVYYPPGPGNTIPESIPTKGPGRYRDIELPLTNVRK